ncbi:MAG TPA: hypothetical protein VK849_03870 [Longimicrobiales bacterium]|nr:hypothetical protein [Longimicrobiales bacterium]
MGGRDTSRRLLAAALAGCAGLTPPVAAQETVRSVRMSADLTRGGATVTVEVELEGARPGATLSATILDFGEASAAELAVGSDGAPGALSVLQGTARSATLPVEPGAVGSQWVVATYQVAHAVTVDGPWLRAHVPVLSVDRAPAEARPGLFRAELRVPPEWSVTEGFPSRFATSDEPGVYAVELPVVPSVISFRGRSDGAWRPGVPLLLDLLAGVIILAFSTVGLRHLRRVAAA